MSRREGSPPPAPEPLRGATVDAHTHLDALDVEVADVVAAARAVGVVGMVTTGDSVASSRWCAGTAAAHDGVLAAVAIHPNEAGDADDAAFAEIASLATLSDVRAVGETGLDNYWERVEPAVQQEAFRRHIAIAKDTGKTLVIHDRDAHDDVLRILAEEGAPEHTVFHCFSGDADMARVCADRGYVMSFAGTVTFKNAASLRDAAKIAPAELILVETDAPFLTPAPYRGRPNAPYLVPLTVRCLAEVRGAREDEIAATTTANAERVFGPFGPAVTHR
ncbi:MAG: TatD family hydrolase [Streptosporangiales bacterium]|nr:TatD family hydrolase [Streptosporangiales bacterium]MBO0892406.1 TatD family hydrolase [Acidothermales bacterium]